MKRFLYIVLSLAVCRTLYSQDKQLNRTVQVTADYDVDAIPGERTAQKLSVPDSLRQFDVNFKYSGFEKAYKGGTEFNPFRTELEINRSEYSLNALYLKIGAGYTFNPELELDWALKRYGRLKLNLFARNTSYFGPYWEPYLENGCLKGGYGTKSRDGDDNYRFGAQSLTKMGFDGRADWEKVSLNFALWYDGVIATDNFRIRDVEKRFWNGGKAKFSIGSNKGLATGGFVWNVDVHGGYGADFLHGGNFDSNRSETNCGGDIMLRYNFPNSAIELGLDYDGIQGKSTTDSLSAYVGWNFGIRPEYYYLGNRFSFGIGVAMIFAGVDGHAYAGDNFNPFPLFNMRWQIVPGYFEIYADTDMKARTFGLGEQALEHAFYIPDELKNIEKDAWCDFGFKGDVDGAFEYDASFIYDWRRNSSEVYVYQDNVSANLLAEICHQEVQDVGCNIELKGRFCGFTLGCDARYKYFLNRADLRVVPSALSAGLKLEYDYLTRINAFVGARYNSDSYSTAPDGDIKIPGWTDLYAGVSYRFTGKFSIYLKGENLLNMQQNILPLYSRRGIAVTGGIVLNL